MDTAFGGLSATRPFVIIDEPHKFKTANVTWGNIETTKRPIYSKIWGNV